MGRALAQHTPSHIFNPQYSINHMYCSSSVPDFRVRYLSQEAHNYLHLLLQGLHPPLLDSKIPTLTCLN